MVKVCQICERSFTRQWNLDRHMQGIHNIPTNGEYYRIKPKYEGPLYTYPSSFRNEQFRNYENNTTETGYYENPSVYPYITYNYSSHDSYNNRFYDDFEPVSPDKKEKKLTFHDVLRIQRGLKILINYLQRIYPNSVVYQQIYWLNYLCYTKKSIQPLRDFYQKKNLMYIWPID